ATTAEDKVDLIFEDQFARVPGRGRRVGRIVELDQRDLVAADLGDVLDPCRGSLRIGNADRGDRTRKRRDQSDLDLSDGGAGSKARSDEQREKSVPLTHCVPPWSADFVILAQIRILDRPQVGSSTPGGRERYESPAPRFFICRV